MTPLYLWIIIIFYEAQLQSLGSIEQHALNERKQMSYYCEIIKLAQNFKTSHLSCQFSHNPHILLLLLKKGNRSELSVGLFFNL